MSSFLRTYFKSAVPWTSTQTKPRHNVRHQWTHQCQKEKWQCQKEKWQCQKEKWQCQKEKWPHKFHLN